jgi:hypothetical protein
MTLKMKMLLSTGGTAAIILFGAIFYFTSDHHKYNIALKRYRLKEYKATIGVLDSLKPKYQRSSKSMYLRGVCQHNLALQSYGRKRYDESLGILASIPETYMQYDEVKKLQNEIKQAQLIVAETLRHKKEVQQKQTIQKAEAEKRQAEEQALQKIAERERRSQELKQAKEVIQPLYDTGFLTKFDIDMNEGWVDPSLWAKLDYDAKFKLAVILANICNLSDSTGRIVILNNKTGKRLAAYSQTLGFKHY